MPILNKIKASETKQDDEYGLNFLIEQQNKNLKSDEINKVESYEAIPEELTESEILRLQNRIQDLEYTLGSIFETYDNQYKNLFLQGLSNLIIDSQTATSAKTVYNKAWFSSSLFSIDAKQDIAATLIKLCESRQKGSSADFWQRIVSGDAETLAQIDYKPKED